MFIEMRLVWLWVMLVLVSECYGCLEKERIALLQIKASIHNPNRNTVETWEEAWKGEATTDCCGWEGVKCNTKTGRVIQLSLIVEHIIYWRLEDRCLNVSMFLPFEELESLDLSNNGLQGCLENNEGFFIVCFQTMFTKGMSCFVTNCDICMYILLTVLQVLRSWQG
ncbi:hypothetical protein CsSME_00007912 [Camellia sinensis var. sinensis]